MLCQSKDLFLRAGNNNFVCSTTLNIKEIKKRSMKLSFLPILTAARTLNKLFLALNDFEEFIELPLFRFYSEVQIQITFDIFYLLRAFVTYGTAGIFETFSPYPIDVCSIYNRTWDCVMPV